MSTSQVNPPCTYITTNKRNTHVQHQFVAESTDTYASLCRNGKRLNTETLHAHSSPRTIATNESLSLLQKQSITESINANTNEQVRALETDPYFDGDETELLLQQAIATLPDKQRIVFNLKYFEEKPYTEISQLLHTSEGALKASYHIAVKKIELFFAEHD